MENTFYEIPYLREILAFSLNYDEKKIKISRNIIMISAEILPLLNVVVTTSTGAKLIAIIITSTSLKHTHSV